MALTIILTPYKDPTMGGCWDEQTKQILSRLESRLSTYSSKLKYELKPGVEGCGADFPIIILRILEIGAIAFFTIPEFKKRLNEALQGWREIANDICKLIDWLQEDEKVTRHSIEVAFYTALISLSDRMDVGDLELIEMKEILGHSEFVHQSFENTEIAYYLFIFKEKSERIHILCMDEKLKVHIDKSLTIDAFTRFSEEKSAG